MQPYVDDVDFKLYLGDVRQVLAELPGESVDCCVTSPPYWGLRDYGADGQLGLEPTPEAYVEALVSVFRDVQRVLSPAGTLWLNLGDSYSRDPGKGGSGPNGKHDFIPDYGKAREIVRAKRLDRGEGRWGGGNVAAPGLKPKDLVGIPWRVAFALQADGWYLRSDIIWHKPNPMPESVTDRPTKSHEYVFLLSKSPRYFFDQEAVREPLSLATVEDARYKRALTDDPTPYGETVGKAKGLGAGPRVKFAPERNDGNPDTMYKHPPSPLGRNVRTVWEIATVPFAEAHFATWPETLVERILKAGCPEQVCATCGKARERIVVTNNPSKAHYDETTALGYPEKMTKGGNAQSSKSLHRQPGGVYSTAQTIGWTDCGHDNYRPGIALDPFMGSGTTARVARRLGRSSVGVELNEEYAAMCARRLGQQSLLAG